MRIIAIHEFNAHALKALDEVEKTREIVIITKRGKPIANVIPHCNTDADNVPGKLCSPVFFGEKREGKQDRIRKPGRCSLFLSGF